MKFTNKIKTTRGNTCDSNKQFKLTGSLNSAVKRNFVPTMMNRIIRTCKVALCLSVLTGCDDGLSVSDHIDLRQAMDKWAATNYQSYIYETRVSCFCPPEISNWCQVTVLNGVVSRVLLMGNGADMDTAFFKGYPTISELFLELFMVRGDLEVEFDDEIGYPTIIDVAPDPNATDSGFTRYCRNLRPYTTVD